MRHTFRGVRAVPITKSSLRFWSRIERPCVKWVTSAEICRRLRSIHRLSKQFCQLLTLALVERVRLTLEAR